MIHKYNYTETNTYNKDENKALLYDVIFNILNLLDYNTEHNKHIITNETLNNLFDMDEFTTSLKQYTKYIEHVQEINKQITKTC